MIKRLEESSLQPSRGNDSLVKKVLRQSAGSDHQQLVFEEHEEHKGITSSFSSDIKRIETSNSMATEIIRDRGVSSASQNSHETSTHIVRLADENESSSSTLNSLLNVNKISNQRMKTQQVRNTAAELAEELK
jgi:hypothetical protein